VRAAYDISTVKVIHTRSVDCHYEQVKKAGQVDYKLTKLHAKRAGDMHVRVCKVVDRRPNYERRKRRWTVTSMQ